MPAPSGRGPTPSPNPALENTPLPLNLALTSRPRISSVRRSPTNPSLLSSRRYDGVRAQVHLKPDGSLRFFSRSSKDSSAELPDLIPVMKVRRRVQHCRCRPRSPVPHRGGAAED